MVPQTKGRIADLILLLVSNATLFCIASSGTTYYHSEAGVPYNFNGAALLWAVDCYCLDEHTRAAGHALFWCQLITIPHELIMPY